MTDIFIEASGIKRGFPTSEGEFWALKGINAAIPRGKLTILKGRSGSGKTTLSEGDVLYAGKSIVRMSEKQRAHLRRTQIGFVFQSVALIPMMNAQENVEYALRMARISKNRQQRALECLKMVGLSARAKHMPQELSGGEQQRVAIARALAHSPQVIFADEPTGELDTVTGLQVVKIFKDLTEQEGVTIVMTTHDTSLMEVGDAVYELEDGEVIHGSV